VSNQSASQEDPRVAGNILFTIYARLGIGRHASRGKLIAIDGYLVKLRNEQVPRPDQRFIEVLGGGDDFAQLLHFLLRPDRRQPLVDL
jgi:hypothetical protein